LKNLLDIYLAMTAAILYLLAAFSTGLDAILPGKRLGRSALLLAVAGLATHTVGLVARGILAKGVPLTDLFEYTLFLSWAIALAYLAVFRKRVTHAVTIAILAVLFLMLGSSLLYYTDPAGGTMPALRSYWLYIHVSLAALGETFFAIAFVSSLVYLIRSATGRREGLPALDDLTYRAISIGFPLFTAGALVAGAIWAKQAWGAYWSWDPKEVMSLVVWLVYAVYLHARLVRDLRGRFAAAIAVAGFVLTLFTIFSTLVFGGLHAYG
jgi:ABC-type transport system involved in cytochrome c biogenesis permease subunit